MTHILSKKVRASSCARQTEAHARFSIQLIGLERKYNPEGSDSSTMVVFPRSLLDLDGTLVSPFGIGGLANGTEPKGVSVALLISLTC